MARPDPTGWGMSCDDDRRSRLEPMMRPSKLARTLREARWSMSLEPLAPDDPRRVEALAELRGRKVVDRIITWLDVDPDSAHPYEHVCFAGQRGSGKTSDLNLLKARLKESRVYVVQRDADAELPVENLDYSDIILAVARAVLEDVGKDFGLNEAVLEPVLRWFAEATEIDLEEAKKAIDLETKATAEAGIPFLARFLAMLKADVRFEKKEATERRLRLKRIPDELIRRVNELLAVCRGKTQQAGRNGLVVLLDNLDRLNPDLVETHLVQKADLHRRLACHIVFTVPLSLLLAPRRETVADQFRAVEIHPMVAIRTRQMPWEQYDGDALRVLRQVFERRMVVPEIFENKDECEEMIKASGGSLRELVRIFEQACIDATGARLTVENIRAGIRDARDELMRHIESRHYPVLARIHLTKRHDNSQEAREILFWRWALQYDRDQWFDVHPLVYDVPEFQDALREEQAKRPIS